MGTYHILRLLRKVGNDDAAMLFYAQETVTKAWNRDLLLNAINLNMYGAQALTKVDNYFAALFLPNKPNMPMKYLTAAINGIEVFM